MLLGTAGVKLLSDQLAVTPEGNPAQVSVTSPEKLPPVVTLYELLEDPPCTAVMVAVPDR